MTLWILAIATAFSAVQSVRMPLASVRIRSLPALQPAKQRRQPAVVSLQSTLPLFAVRGAVRPRHVAGKAPTTSAAAWLGLSALLAAAALVTRVARTTSECSGYTSQTDSSISNRALRPTRTQCARVLRLAKRSHQERVFAANVLDVVHELRSPNLAQSLWRGDCEFQRPERIVHKTSNVLGQSHAAADAVGAFPAT